MSLVIDFRPSQWRGGAALTTFTASHFSSAQSSPYAEVVRLKGMISSRAHGGRVTLPAAVGRGGSRAEFQGPASRGSIPLPAFLGAVIAVAGIHALSQTCGAGAITSGLCAREVLEEQRRGARRRGRLFPAGRSSAAACREGVYEANEYRLRLSENR